MSLSPFKVHAGPAHDASKVRASGPGLDKAGVPASLPVEFTIDARDAGEGLLTVQILVSSLFSTQFFLSQPGLGVLKPGLGVLQPGLGVHQPGLGVLQPDLGVLQPGLGVLQTGLGVLLRKSYPEAHTAVRCLRRWCELTGSLLL